MHIDQFPYRQLYDDLMDFSGAAVYQDVLAPWIEAHPKERDWLRAFGKRTGDPFPPATIEDLWRLYAVSRVNELLLYRYQPSSADGTPSYESPELSISDYERFAADLSLEPVPASQFSPFFHEIVTDEPSADSGAPITVVAEYWPALMLGDMMFSRAGVAVRGGSDCVDSEIAASSTIYWAFRRKNRPYHDLSRGWGSNSQWRTSLRRDYRIRGRLHFNVDGKYDLGEGGSLGPNEDGLSLAERLELLTNRCFIRTAKPHEGLWPYDGRYSVPIE